MSNINFQKKLCDDTNRKQMRTSVCIRTLNIRHFELQPLIYLNRLGKTIEIENFN